MAKKLTAQEMADRAEALAEAATYLRMWEADTPAAREQAHVMADKLDDDADKWQWRSEDRKKAESK